MIKIVILPIGSIEQHGPHLPIDTDLRIVEMMAKGIANCFPQDQAVLLPTLPYSCSWEHKGPGTIALNTSTLSAVIHDIASSLKNWKRQILFALVNWHGGNSALASIATEITAREHIPTIALQTMKVATEIWGENLSHDIHAGTVETAILQAFWPDLIAKVDLETLDYTPDISPVEAQIAFQALGIHGVTPHGIWGNPSLADAQKAQHIMTITIQKIYQELQHLLALLDVQ